MAKTTQAERDRNEHNNIRVVNDFKNYWFDLGVDLRHQSVGMMFRAQVHYASPKSTAVEQTDVRISTSGYGTDGAINIVESGDLVSEDFHLGMAPAFGTYKLDKKTGDLSITHSSDKMGGTFTVRIVPLV